MSDPLSSGPVVPSTPTPVPANIILSVIKLVVVAAGIAGVTLPPIFADTGTMQTLAGTVATLIGIVWQVIDEYRHASTTHAVAVASAQAGTPVKPV